MLNFSKIFLFDRIFLQRSNQSRAKIGLLIELMICGFVLGALFGCGTTKFSDTSRTATEQFLITSAMEDVIDEFDFSYLTGRKIFVNSFNCTDEKYFLTILRQQLAANGVLLKDNKDEADYILEVAPGVVGTNRYDRMYGVPETKIPAVLSGGTSTTIPEMALIKRTDQKAAVKVIIWAYNKTSGEIIWQSGSKTKSAFIRDRWFFGAGPFTKSSFEKNIQIAGDTVKIPENPFGEYILNDNKPSVTTEAIYREIDPKSREHLDSIRQKGLEQLKAKQKENKADSDSDPDKESSSIDSDSDVKENPDEKKNVSTATNQSDSEEEKKETEPFPLNSNSNLTASTLDIDSNNNPTTQNNLIQPNIPVQPKSDIPSNNPISQKSGNVSDNQVLSHSSEQPVLQFDQLTLPLKSTIKFNQ